MPNQNQSPRSKVRAFLIAETVAISILLLAGGLVLSAGPLNSTLVTALNAVMFAAAVGVAAIPIFLFAFAPILPRSGR
ncbi:MAG TPA: hypothetical protein VGW57_01455 [Chthoniobacterales bacterium]|nr:hypothetical protein [Chthoniobacterales bacterium]